MVDLRGGKSFAHQYGHEAREARPLGLDHLERDVPARRILPGDHRRPEPAAAEFSNDPVASDPSGKILRRTGSWR
ncbi:MAG: hypothetical protein U0835_18095 [Isosphaeraceae bacterium]